MKNKIEIKPKQLAIAILIDIFILALIVVFNSKDLLRDGGDLILNIVERIFWILIMIYITYGAVGYAKKLYDNERLRNLRTLVIIILSFIFFLTDVLKFGITWPIAILHTLLLGGILYIIIDEIIKFISKNKEDKK